MLVGSFSVRVAENAAIVEILGEVDISNVQQFVDALDDATERGEGTVIVSFEHAEYIDSCTINALIERARELSKRNMRMLVAAPKQSSCNRIFALIGIDQLLDIRESVEEATRQG